MSRLDWLALFLLLPGGSYPSDRIRIMKGIFLLSQAGPKEMAGLYHFEPYRYGPFDVGIYLDLETLEAAGRVRRVITDEGQWAYTLTAAGREFALALKEKVDPKVLELMSRIKQRVTSVSFLQLLQEVYAEYPAFSVQSVASL